MHSLNVARSEVVVIATSYLNKKRLTLTCEPTSVCYQIFTVHTFCADRQREGGISEDGEDEKGRR